MEEKPLTREQQPARRAYKRAWNRKKGGFRAWKLGGKGCVPVEQREWAAIERIRALREEADRLEREIGR